MQPTHLNALWTANPIQIQLVNHLDLINGSFSKISYAYYPKCSTQPIQAQNRLGSSQEEPVCWRGPGHELWLAETKTRKIQRLIDIVHVEMPLILRRLLFVTPLCLSCAPDTTITCAHLCLLLCSRSRCFFSALLEVSGESLCGFSQNMWFHFKVCCVLLIEGIDIRFLGWCCLKLFSITWVPLFLLGFEFI